MASPSDTHYVEIDILQVQWQSASSGHGDPGFLKDKPMLNQPLTTQDRFPIVIDIERCRMMTGEITGSSKIGSSCRSKVLFPHADFAKCTREEIHEQIENYLGYENSVKIDDCMKDIVKSVVANDLYNGHLNDLAKHRKSSFMVAAFIDPNEFNLKLSCGCRLVNDKKLVWDKSDMQVMGTENDIGYNNNGMIVIIYYGLIVYKQQCLNVYLTRCPTEKHVKICDYTMTVPTQMSTNTYQTAKLKLELITNLQSLHQTIN